MHSFVFQNRSLYVTVLLMVLHTVQFTIVLQCHYQLYADLHSQSTVWKYPFKKKASFPEYVYLQIVLLHFKCALVYSHQENVFTHFPLKETHLWQSDQLHQQADHYSHVTQYKTHLRWPPLLQQHLSSQLWAASQSRHACTVYWWTSPQAKCPVCCPSLHSLQYNMINCKLNISITGYC